MAQEAYQVIARRWRPKQFDELVGQEHIVRTLKNAIESDRIAHAYLFVGPRGTGKTTTARIFAKALNNPDGPSAEFDGSSDIAQAIDVGEDIDVIEIDGAS
ncbi:MAG: AAA family ATPase, partial [Puniceicoccales bacterium]